MSRYVAIRQFLESEEGGVLPTRCSREDVQKLHSFSPALPEDYIEFLETIGYGEWGDGRYMIYSGPVKPDEIYDAESASKLGNLLLLGDDFQGYCAAFDPDNNWQVVEIDPTEMAASRVASSFEVFIKKKFARS